MSAQDVPMPTGRRRVSVRTSVVFDELYNVSEQDPHPGWSVHDARTSVSIPATCVRPQAHQGRRPAHWPTAHQPVTLRRQTGNFIALFIGLLRSKLV